MEPLDLVVSGRRVVLPGGVGPAVVGVANGVIVSVEPERHPGEDPGRPPGRRDSPAEPERSPVRRIDAGDAVVMPGVIDTHVHVNEPGRADWEGFETATRAAAAGGVTTIVDMPLNSDPVTISLDALERKVAAAAGRCHVDVGLWGGVVPGNTSELAALLDAGVLGFKCFLIDSGIDGFPPVTRGDLEEALPVLAERDAVLLVHAELPGPVERATRDLPSGADPRRYETFLATRPADAEHEAVDLLVELAGRYGARVHVVHVSSRGTVRRIARARESGVRITAETCPHYLTFDPGDVPVGGTSFKCAPPIRRAEDREALWDGLRGGALDLVASDHSPCPPALKLLAAGDFIRAWGGISSLQLSLSAAWSGARARGFGPREVARWMCVAPAALAGLGGHKGHIAPGYDADLVIWDPDARFTVDARSLYHRHAVTPYDGRTLHGVVQETILGGRSVFGDGAPRGASGGRVLRSHG